MGKGFNTTLIIIFSLVFIGLGVILYQKSKPYHDLSSLEFTDTFMKLTSPSFNHMGPIPSQFTCDGENVNPALDISEVPEKTEELVLIVDDPDAPSGNWLHWTVWGIDASTKRIEQNGIPENAMQGETSFQSTGYGGPCPPSGEHRYMFTLYALDSKLDIGKGATREELEAAMKDHIIAKTTLTGLYQRP